MAISTEENSDHDRSIPDSSVPGSSLLHNPWIDRFGWLIPILVAFAVYHVGINNYFTCDDFMWLDRGASFKKNWLQIFRPEGAYFDSLVHLMFAVDYLIAGLDHRWYHCVDLTIHAANALLVYRFARMLSDDERAALYGSILFAGSFAIADAVLWSSSRVDLLSTFFSLCALIQFLQYLHGERVRNLFFSFLLFVLALGAKGTPIVLPVILFVLIILDKKPFRLSLRLIPFGVVAIVYLALLKLTAHFATLPVDKVYFNPRYYAVAISEQFIPEEALAHLNPVITAILLLIALSALGFAALPNQSTIVLRRIGFFALLAGTLPVLALGKFTFATRHSNFIDLMGSPSHRIYLASVGVALLGGGVLRSIETALGKFFPKFAQLAVVMLLAVIVAGDALLVKERDKLWETEGTKNRVVVDFLHSYQGKVDEGSLIGLIAFPHSSRAFMESTIRERLGVKDATFNHYVDIGIIVDSKILEKAERSYLFVFGRNGQIYDRSQMYRQQLLLSRRALSNINEFAYASEAKVVTSELIREVNRIIGL
jgi:hypothetical protein